MWCTLWWSFGISKATLRRSVVSSRFDFVHQNDVDFRALVIPASIEKLSKDRALDSASRGTGFDKLVENRPAAVARVLAHGLELRRDRQLFIGLFVGGD